MEPKFKTSFIPKQSLSREQQGSAEPQERGPGSVVTIITVVIFIIVSGIGVVVYLYENILDEQVNNKLADLRRQREAFDPQLLAQMQRLDTRIEAGKQLLDQHVAPSNLFALLSEITLKSVRFQSLDFTATGRDSATIALSGEALNLDAVAWQSDVLGNNQYIQSPVVSGLAVTSEDAVSFQVDARVDGRFLRYAEALNRQQNSGDNDNDSGNQGATSP